MISKYHSYSEYKAESNADWLGYIPQQWTVLRGKYVFKEVNERSESGNEILLSVSEYYGVKPRSESIAEGEHLSRAESLVGYKKCEVNDLVMNIMLAWKRGQGVTKYSGIVSPAYSVYRFFNNANPDFMHYLFRTDLYTGHFKTRSTGVIDSRLRLYPESFFDVSVLLPSIEEQRTIAAFLDYETARIDSLIDKQQRLIELLKEKRQAVISHAVTKGLNPDAPMKDSGVEWLGQVPEHWEVKKFNHCARIRNGLVDPTDIRYRDLVLYAPNHIEKETGKVIYRETALEQGADSNKYLCLKGEVIYSKIRPALAKVALCVEEIALCSADMYPISCTNGLSNSWLYWFMLSDNFTKAVVLDSDRVAMPKVNRDSLGAYRIPFPSTDEQVEISSFLRSQTEKLDQIENEAVNAIQLMQERRTALISAAVTGKIDLRRWTPPREG